jgi:hypothetical protein
MKQLIQMKRFALLVMLVAATQSTLCFGQDIVTDVATLRATNSAATLNIDAIAAKYIVPGAARLEAERYLTKQGFTLHQVSTSGTKHTIMAVKNQRSFGASFGFFDETRVILELEGDVVRVATGWLIYHAL